ncbi:uncharacterized protein LOC129763290 [Toxorhynchites rutilus septentrionalis]|uniref:uncharacterized protein LOC129763290 n=1 Tax=Toxorhynchites rutilus septentrionalis TaxID=329112 RepID=UPI0024788B64|nr:uncharacterized protein LOC129763290 [Toxorhynchites rutilus septentrionalis]
MLWERKELFRLIGEWKLLPVLWAQQPKDIGNKIRKQKSPKPCVSRRRSKKQKALKLLAAKFDTTAHEISRQLFMFRKQYQEERARRARTAGRTYKSTWEFYNACKFMSGKSSNDAAANKIMKPKDFEAQKHETDNGQRNVPEKKAQQQPFKTELIHAEEEKDPHIEVMYKSLGDEHQIFGDYVASEMRNLKNEDTRRQMKISIHRAIMYAIESDAYQMPDDAQSERSFPSPGAPEPSFNSTYDFDMEDEKPLIMHEDEDGEEFLLQTFPLNNFSDAEYLDEP